MTFDSNPTKYQQSCDKCKQCLHIEGTDLVCEELGCPSTKY